MTTPQNIRDIIETRLSDEDLRKTVEYFVKTAGPLQPSLLPFLKDFIKSREKEVFGAPKFEAAMYGANLGLEARDPLDEGE